MFPSLWCIARPPDSSFIQFVLGTLVLILALAKAIQFNLPEITLLSPPFSFFTLKTSRAAFAASLWLIVPLYCELPTTQHVYHLRIHLTIFIFFHLINKLKWPSTTGSHTPRAITLLLWVLCFVILNSACCVEEYPQIRDESLHFNPIFIT